MRPSRPPASSSAKPRYGMAPDWARATRPLVVIITMIGLLVTVLFEANVNQQAGAYATGVLMLMTSSAVAVAIARVLPGLRALRYLAGIAPA